MIAPRTTRAVSLTPSLDAPVILTDRLAVDATADLDDLTLGRRVHSGLDRGVLRTGTLGAVVVHELVRIRRAHADLAHSADRNDERDGPHSDTDLHRTPDEPNSPPAVRFWQRDQRETRLILIFARARAIMLP